MNKHTYTSHYQNLAKCGWVCNLTMHKVHNWRSPSNEAPGFY